MLATTLTFQSYPYDSVPATHHVNYLAIFLLAVFVIVVVTGFISCFRIVEQQQKGVVYRFGRITGEREPGLHLVLPFGIDRMELVDMFVQTLSLDDQRVITKDSVTIGVQAVAYFQVTDATQSLVSIDNPTKAIRQLCQSITRKIVGQHDLSEILGHTQTIVDAMRAQLAEEATAWGLSISRVELKDIQLPKSMQRAMAAPAEAEREAQAKVAEAKGELDSAELLEQAASHMGPTALELRRLQTLREIGTDQAAIIVVSNGVSGDAAAQAAAGNLAAGHIAAPKG